MNTPVRRIRTAASGDGFTIATLATMRDVVNASVYDPVVIEAAVSAVQDVQQRYTTGQARAIRDFLAEHIEFLSDPLIEGDVLRTPRYLLDLVTRDGIARGDCDDAAMLAAALGKAIGLPARFVVLDFDPRLGFQHVFTELLTARGWREMDITEEDPERRAAAMSRRAAVMDV